MLLAACAVLGLLGLVVGSFLNVVIARVPAGESVVRPRSRCPRCGTPIAVRDNIPVVSWVALRGRARCCGLPISPRYPAVELATAAAFALVGWWALQPRPDGAWPPREAALPALLYLAAVSIALAVIDIDTFRLPFWIVAPSYPVAAVLLAVASLTARDGGSVLRMLLGGAALWGVYRLLHAVYPGGMGYGDVRLAGVLGLYLGWLGWGTLVVGGFLGFLTGAVGGLAVVALRRGGLKTSIPYGPYMLAGAWLAIPFGDTVVRWYLTAAGLPTG